jgi:hypothetical protein
MRFSEGVVCVDAVLGLAMTPSSIGLVLVEGNDVDGFTMDHDAVEIMNSDDATAAVLRSEALAATRGLRLKSIGLTWSDDADAEASMLMQSLSESGFDNVVPHHRRVHHRAGICDHHDRARGQRRRPHGREPFHRLASGPHQLAQRGVRPRRLAAGGPGGDRLRR